MSTTQGRLLGGRYRLGAPLGRGGMAVVWRADDEMLGREVAVKTLDLTGPDSDNAGERFRREARATAMLNHPHIVTVFDTGVEDHTAYLVMELLPGPTLAEEVRDAGPLPIDAVRTIGYEVAGALQAAHDAGIVHRDIKPGNISYAADGTVKVLDFGITQLLDEALGHHQLTMTDTIVGTAEYLAPEQATGQRVDARADLYALGCVLTTLLTGSPPFTAPTPVAILMKHAHDVPADVRDARPDTPADLAGLITALLAKDPTVRPQSGTEVAQPLRSHTAPALTEVIRPAAAAAPTAVVPRQEQWSEPAYEPAYEPAWEPEPRRSRAWIWLLLLAVAIAAAGIWYLQTREDGTPDTPTSSSSSSTPSATPTTESSTPTPTTASPTPTITETKTETPTQSPTPSATPPDTATPVTDASGALSDAVDALSAEDLDSDVAKSVQAKLRQVNQAVKAEDRDRVNALVAQVNDELAQARKDEKLSEPGQAQVSGPLADLKQAAADFQP